MKRPEIGKPAPALRLNDQTGNIVELAGKRAGWTVLAFFPKAATPG
jgi:peroxiredoxin